MDLLPSSRRFIILVCLCACLPGHFAVADDRRVIDYSYDASGNLVEKNTDVTLNSLAPIISSITPANVRHNASALIVLTGNYLKNLQLSTDHPGLAGSHIESSNSQAGFHLIVAADVPLGMHTLTFSTLSGQVSQVIQVLPQLPEMVIRPSPLAIVSGKDTEVTFGISHIDVVDHEITVTIADENIAVSSASLFVITAGERFPAAGLKLTGLQTGATGLIFSSQLLGTQAFTMTVGNEYQPPAGTNINVYSDFLGMFLPSNSPDSNETGPYTSSLSIALTPVVQAGSTSRISHLSPLLNIVFDSVFTQVTPQAIAEGKSDLLVIKGHGLAEVTDISMVPEEGVVLGELQINQDATEITVPVSINAAVPYSMRTVKLYTSSTEIAPSQPAVARVFVGGSLPDIISLHPVVVSRLSWHELNIRGESFDGYVQVNIIPPDDIGIGSRSVINAERTQLSVDLNIGEYADLGQRVITVKNLNGTSTSTALPSNTLTIANAIGGEVPVTSSPIGLVTGSGVVQQQLGLYSAELSVVSGSGITAVHPSAAAAGTEFTLTLEGYHLDDVTALIFEPSQGISVSPPQVAVDGLSLTVDVAIAGDAETGSRKMSVLKDSTKVSFIEAEDSQFTVSWTESQITFLSPDMIIAGSSSPDNVFALIDAESSIVASAAKKANILTAPAGQTSTTKIAVKGLTADPLIQ